MTDLVPVRKNNATQVPLAHIQDRLAALAEKPEVEVAVASTKKARTQEARRGFKDDPLGVLLDIEDGAKRLADRFDAAIVPGPLSQDQIDKLSEEYMRYEALQIRLAILGEYFREVVFGHFDATGPKIPGRPATHVPGRIEASGPGPRVRFERRGGNSEDPTLNADGFREALPAELAAQVFVTIHHPAVEAWTEEAFDPDKFNQLVESGKIDLDVVAPYLKPGKRRTPTFNVTLVDGDK